jgi:hypothetical protein
MDKLYIIEFKDNKKVLDDYFKVIKTEMIDLDMFIHLENGSEVLLGEYADPTFFINSYKNHYVFCGIDKDNVIKNTKQHFKKYMIYYSQLAKDYEELNKLI